MEYVLEHIAVAVCAVTGVLAGRGKRVDLFGVVVLAMVTAVGGGTLRDVLLDITPVFWVADPNYILTAAGVALLTFLVPRVRELPSQVLLAGDAFGLALFTILGAEKSLAASAPPAVTVVLGVLTGVAGGMLRDMLTGEIPLVFRPEIRLYATAALCGALLFILLHRVQPGSGANRLAAMGLILALRLAAIRWRIALPVFEAGSGPGDADRRG
jgi:uncharacterized membrane protein YeiH